MNTVLLALCAFAALASASPRATCTLPPKRVLAIPGAKSGLAYYATTALGEKNDLYTLAVSYQHGMYSDPDVHYCAILGAMQKRFPGGNKSILLIAPHFQDDWSGCPAGELYWEGQSWNMGDNSSAYDAPTVSSFTVYDHLISVLNDKVTYPNMNRIVLVGHSAGGQTMVRYSLGTRTPEPAGGLRLVVSNPSTFPYLDNRRPVAPDMTKFATPTTSQVRNCPDYDMWRYGLNEMNEYMVNTGKQQAINQYPTRDVVYLLGTADTCNEDYDPTCDSHGLDKGCEAMLQGKMRYERGCTWMRFLETFYGKKTHSQVDVPNVAHDETAMIQAKEALPVFFD